MIKGKLKGGKLLQKDTKYSDAFGGCLKDSGKPDFVIYGIPFDEKSSFRQGASGGPDSIREVSTSKSIGAFTESGVDLSTDAVVIDNGNLIYNGDYEQYLNEIEANITKIVKSGSIPVTMGGDHSISYPLVKGVLNKYNTLNVVWLDAHPDIYDTYEGDRYSHACPVARILELDGIQSVVMGGIRASSQEMETQIRKNGIMVYRASNFDEINDLYLQGPTYLSIDIDVLDPSFAPGVANPVSGGISTRQLLDAINSFDFDIVGFDLVETNPKRDLSEITASASAKVIMETIAKIIKRST